MTRTDESLSHKGFREQERQIVRLRADARDFAGLQAPGWVSSLGLAATFLFPLSLAYAVVKHGVLDLPVLL